MANPKHTRSIQPGGYRHKTKERGVPKNLTHLHLAPNQSKKLIKELGPSSIHNLIQDQKLQF